ncbi:MAG: hypothetical protein O7G85_02980 [Planctomycetota bacterium]|nr:hypothetical protein [Planctomycetota bacterium]
MKNRVLLILATLLFVGGLSVVLTGCGGNSRDDVPAMEGVPDDPNYNKPKSED